MCFANILHGGTVIHCVDYGVGAFSMDRSVLLFSFAFLTFCNLRVEYLGSMIHSVSTRI